MYAVRYANTVTLCCFCTLNNINCFFPGTRQWSLVKTRSKKDDSLLALCAKCRYGHSVFSYMVERMCLEEEMMMVD